MAFVNEDIKDALGHYRASFGDMPDGTIYTNEDIAKAVNTGAADGTAGYQTVPVAWDPEIADITRVQCPIQGLIRKRSNAGKTADYYRLTARGEATWQTEDGEANEADDTRKSESSPLKILRVAGRVTGFAAAAGAHFRNSMLDEIREKGVSMTLELERSMILGDTSTNPLEPNGLIELLTENQDNVAGVITLDDVTALLDTCASAKGAPNLMITDYVTRTAIQKLLVTNARYIDPVKIGYGVEALAFNGPNGVVPMITSYFMPTGTGDRRVLALNTNYVEDRVLMETSMYPLARTNDSEKFQLKRYSTLIAKFPEGDGQLYGITDA